MTAYVSILVALVGAIAYVVADGKLAEPGRGAYWAGLFAFLLGVARESIHLFR